MHFIKLRQLNSVWTRKIVRKDLERAVNLERFVSLKEDKVTVIGFDCILIGRNFREIAWRNIRIFSFCFNSCTFYLTFAFFFQYGAV